MRFFSIPAKTAEMSVVFLAIVLLFGTGAPARNNNLAHDIFIFADRLTVDFDFAGLFSPDLEGSIKKGFPLHIDLSVRLKRSIPVWFDPTLDHYQAYINIEYRSFGSRFEMNVLDFAGNPHRQTYKWLENLISGLNEILILACDSVREYGPEDNLYFDYAIEIRRLTSDEISHARDWYRGKGSGEGDTSFKLPENHENIFDQLLDFTGLGPTKYHYSSYIFKPSTLKEVRP